MDTLQIEHFERLGFNYKSNNGIRTWFESKEGLHIDLPHSPSHKFYQAQIIYDPSLNTIEVNCKTTSDYSWEKFYEGYCNNRYQLRNILEMVGLIKPQGLLDYIKEEFEES